MMKSREFVFAVAALVSFGAVAAGDGAPAAIQVDPQGLHAKKYVAFGWEYAYMRPEHFISRLCYCYFKLGLRNRMFNAIYKMAYIYPESLSTLLVTYPDMALDSEVVNTVNNMLKK